MPSIAALASPAGIGASGSTASGSGGEGMAISADFMAAFMATLQGLLDQQMLSASGQMQTGAAGIVQSGESVGGAQPAGAAQPTIDPALIAALQQEAGIATEGGDETDPGAAQSLIEQLLARLGARLDADGATAASPTAVVASEDTDAALDPAATADVPVDPNEAAILAALAGIRPPVEPPAAPAMPADSAVNAGGAKVEAPTPPGDTAPDPLATAQAGKDAKGFVPTLLALQGAGGASDEATPAETTPAATVAAAAQDAQQRPTARTPVTTRTEERMRRIATEIAALTGGAGITGTIEVTGRVKPVTPTAEIGALLPDAATPDLAALKEIAGAALADPAGAAGAEPPQPLEATPRPSVTLVDPAAGAIDKSQPGGNAAVATPAINHHALATAMAAHAARKDTRFEIRMDPAELGKVDVTLDITASGTVRAHMAVERADTLDMMLRDQSTLTRQLEQAGLKLDSGGLEFSLKQDNGQRREPEPRAAQPTPFAADDEETAAADPVAATRLYSRPGASGLDVRV